MMTIFNAPNYPLMKELAEKTLLSLDNPSLPIKTKPILRTLTTQNLIVHTYDQYMKYSDDSDTITPYSFDKFGSQDGSIKYLPENNLYILLYNKNMQKERKIWTIAHELGHYLGKHIEIFKEHIDSQKQVDEKLKELYIQRFEKEANCFAKELLAPSSLIFAIKKCLNIYDIVGIYTIIRVFFRLSQEASFHIASDIIKVKKPYFSKEINMKFKKAIELNFNYVQDYNFFNALTRKYALEIDAMQRAKEKREYARQMRVSTFFNDF